MSSQEYIQIAQRLPPRLLRFFARYPPVHSGQNPYPTASWLMPRGEQSKTQTSTKTTSTTSTSTPSTSSAVSIPSNPQIENITTNSPSDPDRNHNSPILGSTMPLSGQGSNAVNNPFDISRHPITNRVHGPRFSLRRQADLVKLARAHGIEELLPPSKKATAYRAKSREERGLRVRGTGVGQRVKGKIWERRMPARQEKRREAMLKMPKLVQAWKRVGHGRGWKKFPRRN